MSTNRREDIRPFAELLFNDETFTAVVEPRTATVEIGTPGGTILCGYDNALALAVEILHQLAGDGHVSNWEVKL